MSGTAADLLGLVHVLLVVARLAVLGTGLVLVRRLRPRHARAARLATAGLALLLLTTACSSGASWAAGFLASSGRLELAQLDVAYTLSGLLTAAGRVAGLVLVTSAALAGRTSWYEEELAEPLP